MKRRRRATALLAYAVLGAVVILLVLGADGAFVRDVWTRDNPLVGSIPVVGVADGSITLSDGRVFRPAGVGRCEEVPAEAYDRAIGAMVGQGVVVMRDLGDGRAFLLAEPRFYNWCGTRKGWSRWAGAYIRCPLSELIAWSGYGEAEPQQPGLSDRERWRLEGVMCLGGENNPPVSLSGDGRSLRFDPGARLLERYEEMLAIIWKPPPT